MGDIKNALYYDDTTKLSKPATAFDTIERAMAEVAEVSMRVAKLAARLVGEEPSVAGSKERPARSGCLGLLADQGDSIRTAVVAMHDALARIEQQLP